MAFISDRHRFVFIHIEKCGGTSVKEALTRLHGSRVKCGLEELRHSSINRLVPEDFQPREVHGHDRPIDIMQKLPKTVNYDFFTVVRHPAARVLSYYKHKLRYADLDLPRHPDGRFFSFNDTMRLCPGVLLLEPLVYYTQQNRTVNVSWWKLENIAEEWFSILQSIGIPGASQLTGLQEGGLHQLNYDADHTCWEQELNQRSRDLIEAYYWADLETYGYSL